MNLPTVRRQTVMRTILNACFVFFSIASALAQGTLIGPVTRNGSFESGSASPWNSTVAQDASFASHGEWFAVLQSATVPSARDICFQFLSANPADGLTFFATFDARNSVTGFDSVAAYLFARNTNGTFVNAVATPLISPVLSTDAWGSYQTRFQLPNNWDGIGSISLGIQFTKNNTVSGTTYFSYLDNITLQQVPEPWPAALFGLAASLWAFRLVLAKGGPAMWR